MVPYLIGGILIYNSALNLPLGSCLSNNMTHNSFCLKEKGKIFKKISLEKEECHYLFLGVVFVSYRYRKHDFLK